MEKILTPRGGGRTYAICEYAVKHDCNILVPMYSSAILCAQDYIKEIANNLGIEYIGYGETGYSCCIRVRLQSTERGEYEIKVIAASRITDSVRGLQIGNKKIVVDDIDLCFSFMYPLFNIAACSMMTYDPADVALKLTTPQNECVCNSLI